MKENKGDKTHRGNNLIKVLGIAIMVSVILMSIAGAAPFAYITNSGSNNVSVIDTATNNVTATVNLGSEPLQPIGVAVSPDGKKVYVASSNNNTNYSVHGFVSVIDSATNNVTATVPVGSVPFGVAVSPDGKNVYVTNSNSSSVSVIDMGTNTVKATVPVESNPIAVAVSPDGKNVYVVNDNATSIIDTATNNVTGNVFVGNNSFGITVSPDGKKVYVTHTIGSNIFGINETYVSSGNISVIDTATNNVTTLTPKISTNEPGLNFSVEFFNTTAEGTVNLGFASFGVAVNPAGTKIYVTNWNYNFEHFGSGAVFVIDTTTYNVTRIVNVGMLPIGVAVTPDGEKVYVSNTGSNNVSVIDTTTNNVTATVPVGSGPFGVAVGPDGI